MPDILPSDWLAIRLTPVKQDTERWAEFALALQEYWEENFDPSLQELQDARSIYTSSDDVLAKRLSELGDFYPVDSLIGGEDKTLAIAWRKMALLFKDAKYLADDMLLRKFGTIGVTWVELYAPKDQPYGSEFVGLERLVDDGNDPEDYFLTCHATVDVDLETLDSLNITTADFVTQVWDEVDRIRPAHIVFRGVQIYSEIPTTINMGSFIKSADIITIKPDLFELTVETHIFEPATFIRTAETIRIGAE